VVDRHFMLLRDSVVAWFIDPLWRHKYCLTQ